MIKQLIIISTTFFFANLTYGQAYLGVFEAGDNIPFLVIAAEAETGAPTNPIDLSYEVLKEGQTISSGAMATVRLGVATGEFSTSGNTPGKYDILISGIIGGVTACTYQTYTLVPEGSSLTAIASETSGLNGVTPLTQSTYLSYYNSILSNVSDSTVSVTEEIIASKAAIQSAIHDVSQELRIVSRELTRSRLWYTLNTIETPERNVPADRPSHLEIQIASPNDLQFTSPVETFYRIYYYPNAISATKASKEIRSATPPADGQFYRSPDTDW